MTDMPERITARIDYDGEWDGQWCEPGREPLGIHAYHHDEYIRTAALAKLLAEAEERGRREEREACVALLEPAPNAKNGLWAERLRRLQAAIRARGNGDD